jgi:hypothetical protein
MTATPHQQALQDHQAAPGAAADADQGTTIHQLRAALFETLRAVRAGSIDLDRARAVNELAKTLVDTGRVEVDYVRATDAAHSAFLAPTLPASPDMPPGITGVTRHRLR